MRDGYGVFRKVPINPWGTRGLALIALGLIITASGLFMFAGGMRLLMLGGSWYYALAGAGLTGAGLLTTLRRPLGTAVYLLVLAATAAWSVWEAALSFWPLFSRLFALAALSLPLLLLMPDLGWRKGRGSRRPAYATACVIALMLGATLYAAMQPRPIEKAAATDVPSRKAAIASSAGGDWRHWGRTPSGTRYAPLNQITPENVPRLDVAWTYRTGEIPQGKSQTHVVTPLHIDGTLYGCTQSSRLFALDADTGQERWTFDPKAGQSIFPRCRGVGYHDATAATDLTSERRTPACTRRVIATTVDARLIAVDASTGKPCADFGDNGNVSLRVGMGETRPEYYFPTAAPTVVGNLVIVGGLVWDNQERGEPSGVIRAFDVRTGALTWAWDLANPTITGAAPEKQGYTPGTPNVWSTPAFDVALGLVYLPTGNATPDFWGGHRTEADDRYSSSIVALDIATGRERWRFQTVHHDLWDYDVPSQPALYDVDDGRGGTIPALIQTTKRGQIFMLDRRSGTPIADVEERRVPLGGVADERLSSTQPYSVGMPAIGTEPLSEGRMWGLTPLDQLACRIAFRMARYDGEFTPPSTRWTIQYPGWMGGMNWGSVSIAEDLGYLIVNDTRLAVVNRLVPRAVYDARKAGDSGHTGGAPQRGTPWGIDQRQFLSPLGVPCQEPPYGTITAIDLSTRQIVWSMPFGTTQEAGPLGIATRVPMPIGMPTRGGPITTSSGLIFMAAAQDFYFRALDVRSGKELWRHRLPVGAETNPMTYVSPSSGRQFVIISAGGNSATTVKGDYVIAFALR